MKTNSVSVKSNAIPKAKKPEIICRLKPIPNFIPKCCQIVGKSILQLKPSETKGDLFEDSTIIETQYTFSKVFDEFADQQFVFNEIGLPLIDYLVHGKNGLLFFYGNSSSGKRYTINGMMPNDQGMVLNCLDVIFNSIGHLQTKKYVFKATNMNNFEIQTEADAMIERQDFDILPSISQQIIKGKFPLEKAKFETRIKNVTKLAEVNEYNVYSVFVSFFQFSNNCIFDLLEELSFDPITGFRPPQSKILREDYKQNMFVSSCVEIEVKSANEAFDIFEKGQKRLDILHTKMNIDSSRSHNIFNVKIVQCQKDRTSADLVPSNEEIFQSQLSFVDLACFETNDNGVLLKGASLINQSLTTLQNCLRQLHQSKEEEIMPYRDSKLTHLFKSYFNGNGKIKLLICVNPNVQYYDEILNAMSFSTKNKEVEVHKVDSNDKKVVQSNIRKSLVEKSSCDNNISSSTKSQFKLSSSNFNNFKYNNDVLSNLKHIKRNFYKNISSVDIAKMNFRDKLVNFETLTKQKLKNKNMTSNLISNTSTFTEFKKMENKIKQVKDNDLAIKQNRAILLQQKRDTESEMTRKNNWYEKKHNIRNKETKLQNLSISETEVLQESKRDNYFENQSKTIMNYKDEGLSDINKRNGDLEHLYLEPNNLFSKEIDYAHHKEHIIQEEKFENHILNNEKKDNQKLNKLNKYLHSSLNHVKSKSKGSWIEHNSHVIDESNISYKLNNSYNRKFVKNLSEKDLVKSNRYMLTHQELGENGTIITKFLNGEIKETFGGGKSVIFKEVANSIENSKLTNENGVINSEKINDFVDRYELENRVHIGYEGHALRDR